MATTSDDRKLYAECFQMSCERGRQFSQGQADYVFKRNLFSFIVSNIILTKKAAYAKDIYHRGTVIHLGHIG